MLQKGGDRTRLDHYHRIASDDHHPQALAVSAHLFFHGIVEDNIQKDLILSVSELGTGLRRSLIAHVTHIVASQDS